jgi:hypothetical protein
MQLVFQPQAFLLDTMQSMFLPYFQMAHLRRTQ